MAPLGLLDTGPLVSFLAAGLERHEWAMEEWKRLRPPLLTCEPVLTEAPFLMKREGRDTDPLFALLDRGVIRSAFPADGVDNCIILKDLALVCLPRRKRAGVAAR